MPLYLDTTGQPTLGIGICDRCKRKFPLAELSRDRNEPGLMVCWDDNDELDPYRLPPRNPDQITLPFVRPDESVALTSDGLEAEPPETLRILDDDFNYRDTNDEDYLREVIP